MEQDNETSADIELTMVRDTEYSSHVTTHCSFLGTFGSPFNHEEIIRLCLCQELEDHLLISGTQMMTLRATHTKACVKFGSRQPNHFGYDAKSLPVRLRKGKGFFVLAESRSVLCPAQLKVEVT